MKKWNKFINIKEIWNWYRNPKLEQLSKIADALEVSVFEFLDIKVKSVNDIISLVNKMNIATDIDWDIDNYKVCISFKNKENQ